MDTEKLIRDIVANVMSKLDAGISRESNASSSSSAGVRIPGRASARKIVCGVSVRHVHLSREDMDVLFGKGHEPEILKELYQPDSYAYKEAVTIVGPKLNAIQNVRILGPLRDRTQVELAKTDCIILGIEATVRASGDLAGSASAVLIGPKGALYQKEGVIRANRHIHLSMEDAKYFGVSDNDEVDVRVSGPKGLTFNNVQVRSSVDFKSEMHVDTDDANAADIANGALVEIVDASCISPILSPMAEKDNIPPQIPDNSFSGEITDTNVLDKMNAAIPESGRRIKKTKMTNSLKQKKPGKTLITVDDLDDYETGGIVIDNKVLLSPLARDEALKRGIKIKYKK